MRMKMADSCLNNTIPQSSSSSLQTLASAISSPSSKRRSFTHLALHRPPIFGTKITTSESSRKRDVIKRVVTAAMDSYFSDEEFSKKIEELALRFHVSEEIQPPPPPEYPGEDNMIPANIERKANSVELPFSLRIIKKKKQWKESSGSSSNSGFGTSAYCSVKKAFSSMVFIIRELQSYTLQMRELLFYEDLQHILIRVQKELNASFVWLFQQVFSQTPTLMVYVMILLANYSVYSMSNNLAVAAVPPPPAATAAAVENSDHHQIHPNFDPSSVKSFSIISGGGGGGGFRSVASGTDGGGFGGSGVNPTRSGEESVSGQEEEWWNTVVEEAERMVVGDGGGIDREMRKLGLFVSPVTVELEEEDKEDYFRTELVYQTGLKQEPDNPLLLGNYAQFLYVVARDYDRAEDYFKRASKVEPKDAEALSKYANFLWQIRKDLWAAEETYLEAISADPNNSFYAANYAHFLWSTGGEDTCYPLDSPETSFSEDA